MAGYIGAKVGTVTANAADIKGDISATDTTPEITLKNTTETDADGSRGGKITFKGEQSGGEESTLANIQASHDGAADDEKGDLIFRTNDGSDGASPTEAMRIDSSQNVAIGNTVPTGKLTISESAGSNAPTSITADNTYLQLGSGDFGASNNGKFMIGFGFTDGTTNTNSPSYIGFEETSTSGDTKGDLTFHTRDVITDTAPSERVRINTKGHVGINTSTPDANGFGDGSGILAVASDTGSAKTAMLNLIGDGNDTNNTRVASLFYNDASATGAGSTIAGIEAYRASNHATDPGANLVFSTNVGSTGGYAERMRISNQGYVTKPYQPMFDAYISGNVSFNSGTFNLSTGASWGTRTNIGSHFSSGTFTAPVAGNYLFTAGIGTNGVYPTSAYFSCEFEINGTRRYIHWFQNYGSSYCAANNSAVMNLAANDYVRVLTETAQNVTILGISGGAYSFFTGALIS